MIITETFSNTYSAQEALARLRAFSIMLSRPDSITFVPQTNVINLYEKEKVPGCLWPPKLATKRTRLLVRIEIGAFGYATRVEGFGLDTSELILDLAREINVLQSIGKAVASLASSEKRYVDAD